MKIKLFGKVLIEIKNSVSELPPLHDDSAWSAYLAGKGYAVSSMTALKVAAVLRCVDVVARTIASLPLNLMKETENGKEKATKEPLYKILHRLPNRTTTAYEFWHMYVVNLMLTRGAFAKIQRDLRGFIIGLQNIPTGNVSGPYINDINGERYIIVTFDSGPMSGRQETLRESEFMYTPNFRFSSDLTPENPITIAADVLGLTMALNGFAKDYFENGAHPGGAVETQGTMSDPAYDRFTKSFHEKYAGVINQHKILFLEDGAKFNGFESDLEKSQALESRKFAVIEACRIFGVPPHKVFELERATFSNIEQQNIEFVQEAIAPTCVKLEQTMYKDLLTTKQQDVFYAKFMVNGLLRGDIAARTAFYHAMRQDGVFSANTILELEDMDKIPKEDGGDEIGINGNMISLRYLKDNAPKGAQNRGVNQ